MDLFNTIKEKAAEFLNGGVEEHITNATEDLTGQAADLADQAQNAKDDLFGGDGQDSSQ